MTDLKTQSGDAASPVVDEDDVKARERDELDIGDSQQVPARRSRS